MVARFEAAAITATGGGAIEGAHAREARSEETSGTATRRNTAPADLTASSAFLYARFYRSQPGQECEARVATTNTARDPGENRAANRENRDVA